MKASRFTSIVCLLAITCFFTFANNNVKAQSTIFTGSEAVAEFVATVPGTIVPLDVSSLIDASTGAVVAEDEDDFFPILSPQTQEFGTISGPQVSNPDDPLFEVAAFAAIVGDEFSFIVTTEVEEPQPIVFTFNNPELGPLSGFTFSVSRLDNEISSAVRISTFDGDTPLESFQVSRMPEDSNTALGLTPFFVGLVNNDLSQNITRVELVGTNTDNNDLRIFDAQFAFLDAAAPAETCFDLLTDVRLEVEALLAMTENRQDAKFLKGALSCIRWSQNDFFWAQPSGDRLSVYGSSVFTGTAYTISYLQRVKNPQADAIVDDLLNVLECIVDNEIEYAIANNGRESFIERAEDFAALGEIIDGDFDNEVVAALAYKLAWVHAYYSTY